MNLDPDKADELMRYCRHLRSRLASAERVLGDIRQRLYEATKNKRSSHVVLSLIAASLRHHDEAKEGREEGSDDR